MGYVSEMAGVSRIGSGGKIEDLAAPFRTPNGEPFTIFLVPTGANYKDVEVIAVKLYQQSSETVAMPMPVVVNQWAEMLLSELPAGAVDSNTYEVYWGCGFNASL